MGLQNGTKKRAFYIPEMRANKAHHFSSFIARELANAFATLNFHGEFEFAVGLFAFLYSFG